MAPETMQTTTVNERVFIARGLDRQNDNMDTLDEFFVKMRATTVETAHVGDLSTYATSVSFFGVVMLDKTTTVVKSSQKAASGKDSEAHGEDAGSEWHSDAISQTPNTNADVSGRFSAEETDINPTAKVDLWRRALANDADVQSEVENFDYKAKESYTRGERHQAEDEENDDTEDGDEGSEEDEGQEAGQSAVDGEQAKTGKGQMLMTKEGKDFEEQVRMEKIKEYRGNLRLEEERLTKQKQKRKKQKKKKKQKEKQKQKDKQKQQQPQQPESEVKEKAHEDPVITKELRPIGLVYLHSSQKPDDFLHMGEYSMGAYFHEEYRFQHLVCPAIKELVDLAFNNQDCHRLQSIIVDHPEKLYLLEALATSGFKNEGVRRRAFYSNIFKEWKDVTYLAMLATDWMMDSTYPTARIRSESLWDEVFNRHQYECDELLRLEEKSSRLKRTTSLETIKEHHTTVDTGASEVPSTSGDTEPESSMRAKRDRIESRRNSIRESVLSVRRPSMSESSISSISLQSFPSSSSSQWVDLDREG